MTMYDKYSNDLSDLITKSLSMAPSNKKHVIQFDNLSKQSGYMQYFLSKSDDNIIFDTFNRKSNLMMEGEHIVQTYNHFDAENKRKQIKKLHDQGQLYVGEMVNDLKSIIKMNPNKYQGQLVELTGFTNKLLNDHNRTIVTLFDVMRNQEIIEKYKSGKNTYFKVVNDKNYKPFDYVEPTKNLSKLEATLADYLRTNDYSFDQQVSFPNCKHKGLLRFDFLTYIDEDIELYIEVDGQQHYKHIPYFHKTVEDFKLQQKRDKIKDKYMKENEFEFLRIRYDEDIIEKFESKVNEILEV